MTDQNVVNLTTQTKTSQAQRVVAEGAARADTSHKPRTSSIPLLRGLEQNHTPPTPAHPRSETTAASTPTPTNSRHPDDNPATHQNNSHTPATPHAQTTPPKTTATTPPSDPNTTTSRPSDDEVIEHQISVATEFLKRRLNGDYHVDTYGFDEHFNEHIALGLLRILYRQWFRVETRGLENVPTDDGALLVANHSGTIALDSLMLMVALHDEHPAQRHLRLLGADLVFQAPIIGSLARKVGVTLASHADANRLLTDGHTVGVFPEGFKGIGKPFSDRYKLQRFGRGGFVAAALQARKPIIPCAIVGAEETYPMIADLKMVARILGVPFCPITPTWPLLGPLGLVPLPTKWTIEFGEPIPTDCYSDEDLDDPMLVFELTDRVRETIQETLYSLLVTRKSVFH